ncbi:Dihydropteroate synthase [bioreactor metagenome]|uniref:dihydropteroate synthase n=1 Tax=bioreactor metagenome TaxID=1076179 RepID=A0A644Y963_9ZZZZ
MNAAMKKFTLNIRGKLHQFDGPCVMGIINITPDSYFAESRTFSQDAALERCNDLVSEGAAIIDVGAVSTRPGSEYPGRDEELSRLLSVFPLLRREFPDTVFSIDTSNAEVASRLLDEGADIINDISGGEHDEKMFNLIAERKCPYIMMHMRGWPKDMQSLTRYDDLVSEISSYFSEKIEKLHQTGVSDIILDPGFGFSKTTEQNYFLLDRLQSFSFHNKPLLVGISRKSMVFRALTLAVSKSP